MIIVPTCLLKYSLEETRYSCISVSSTIQGSIDTVLIHDREARKLLKKTSSLCITSLCKEAMNIPYPVSSEKQIMRFWSRPLATVNHFLYATFLLPSTDGQTNIPIFYIHSTDLNISRSSPHVTVYSIQYI